MDKFWQIVKYEYTRHVLNKRFIWTVLSLPLMIIGMLLMVLVISFFMVDRSPIGYVDQIGTLNIEFVSELKGNFFTPNVPLIEYASTQEASDALDAKDIQAYFTFPKDFESTRTITIYSKGNLGSEAARQIDAFLQPQIKDGIISTYQQRLDEGTMFLLRSVDGSRQIREDGWLNIVTPFIIGLIFMVVVMTSGGYLLQSLVEEKENRTMEIMVTSVTPTQLMTGKILGNMSVGLTQFIIWAIFIWIGLFIGGKFIPAIENLDLSGSNIAISLSLSLLAFVIVSALMAALGATVTEANEAQQIAGMFTLPIMMPYWFVTPIITQPNGLLARALTYFPLSAPVTLSIRMIFSQIPAWEIIFAFGLLTITAVLSVWMAGRAFRLGMLSYGKRISLRQLFMKEASRV